MRLSVTGRSLIIAAVFTATALALYHYSKEDDAANTDLDSNYPSFESNGFVGEFFDKSGQISYQLSSKTMVYYNKQERIVLTGLDGIYYDNKGSDSYEQGWRLTADTGSIIKDKNSILKGNVHITPTFENAFIKKVSTPYVFFDMQNNTISSPFKILIEGKDFINQGKNYIIDLTNKTFTIKDEPHAIYYPSN